MNKIAPVPGCRQDVVVRAVCQTLALTFIAMVMMTTRANAEEIEKDRPGSMVRINGSNVHIHCTGAGRPTVLLEAGLGGNSLEWQPVQELLGKSVRVCSYDRPGYGWSELATTARNASTIARELDSLLTARGLPPPYILVGHSFGGHIVRLYSSRHPQKVAGIILVDASHEGLFDVLGGGKSTMLVTVRSPKSYRPGLPENLPEKQKHAYRILSGLPRTHLTLQNENYYFRRSAEEVKRISPPPNVPVTVISRGDKQRTGDRKSTEIANRWHEMQLDLYRRLGNGEHVIAHRSGHYPHLDQPELVADAILQMARRVPFN